MSDPAKYRTKEEVSEMREQNDPIANLKAIMIDNLKNLSAEKVYQEIVERIKLIN